MDREAQLALVHTLTGAVITTLCPEQAPRFTEEFSAFALTAGLDLVAEGARLPAPLEHGLDTTLVAGMFFQILVEAESLPAGTPERVSFVRRRAKNFLVTRLAGQISLPQFFRLLTLIEQNVHRYFSRLKADWLGGADLTGPPLSTGAGEEGCRWEDLRQALAQLDLTPKKGKKLSRDTLCQYLGETRGQWFRLLDFERRFEVNKKTAWIYLHHLHEKGILAHNGEKANRARYALAPRFRQ